jgi:opacity protein-like surface antigen
MRFITMAVLAGLGASAAMAADSSKAVLPPAPVLEDEGGIETWYLRGDVGYVHHRRPEADFTALPFSGGFIDERIGRSTVAGLGVAGLGIGYRFGPNLRADVTLDHRFDARFKGVAATPAGLLLDRGLFQSSALMANGYLDLGTFMDATPYIGAGVGVAWNVLSDHARASYDPATGEASRNRIAGGGDHSLAWALMAGVGYQLSSGFTFDLGYRYVSLGDVKTRAYGAGAGVDVASIGAHEMRVGVRYAFE